MGILGLTQYSGVFQCAAHSSLVSVDPILAIALDVTDDQDSRKHLLRQERRAARIACLAVIKESRWTTDVQ